MKDLGDVRDVYKKYISDIKKFTLQILTKHRRITIKDLIMIKKISFLLVGLSLFTYCSSPKKSGKISFENVTEKAGLIEPLKGMRGHGVAWGDITGNGYPDLFVGTFSEYRDSVYGERGHVPYPAPDKLILNNGDGTFTEVVNSPVNKRGRNSGAAFADFDNDGDLDLVVSHSSIDTRNERYSTGNFLFKNDGKGNLTDVTEGSGLDIELPFTARNTFVFDFDGDGLLDIFMQEDYLYSVSGVNSRLMKNMGNLQFKDVTAEAGLPSGHLQGLHGIGGWVGDINNDTWPDIFFAHSNRLFINNGDGTFREKEYEFTDPRFTAPLNTTGGSWTCGADIGDLNNDGNMDMVMGNHFHNDDTTTLRYLYVYLNEGNDASGDPIFRNITTETNIGNPSTKTPHVQIKDFDNDGIMDIMSSGCEDFIYRNIGVKNGIPMFEPFSSGEKGGIGYWAAGPAVDYDRDGRLDFLGAEWEPSVMSPLLRNVTPNAENYLAVKLELDGKPNRNGIGAKVDIYKKGMLGKKKGRIATQQISVSNGYSSGYEAIVYFGLPKEKEVDVMVSMPSGGEVYTAKSVKRNQLYVFK